MNDQPEAPTGRPTPKTFLLLLALVVFVVFPKVALGLNTFFFRDFGALGYPYAFYFRESLLRGELPFWNPYSHCGVPFLAQMGTLYPPMLLALFLPMPWSINFFILLHLVWGGAGMFWLLRRWGMGNFAAGVAGFAFVFNGVTFSCLIWGNYIASLSWMPWVVGCVMAAWQRGGRWMVVASVVSAMQVLTATPELTLLCWVCIGLLWLVAVGSREAKWGPSLARLALVVTLAAGMVMVQMLPFFDLLAHSQRDHQRAQSALWSMPRWGWANLLLPLFHTYRAPQGQWFQPRQEFLVSYYLGAGAMALAVTGLILKRRKEVVAVAVMALFCWILALGPDGGLYEALRRVVPLVSLARFPVKFTLITAFLLPLLAAWGVEQVARNPKHAGRLAGAVAAGVLMVMMLLLGFAKLRPFPNENWPAMTANALVRAALMLGLVACVWIQAGGARGKVFFQLLALAAFPLDALTHNSKLTPTIAAANLAPGLWQAAGNPAPPKPGEGRVLILPEAERQLNFTRVADMTVDFTGKRLAEWYNLNLLDRVPKVNGAITLRPAHFDVIERYLYYTPGAHVGDGLVDFLSVAWTSSPTNLLRWAPRKTFLPVITAGQRPVFANDAQVFAGIVSDEFEPRSIVYLPESSREWVSVTNRTTCAIGNVRFGQNRVQADVNAASASLVVLSQTYYHRWSATVDGRSVPLLRANLAFQALEVPAGTHRIQLVYRDPNFAAGGAMSLAALAICGLIWFRNGRIE